MLDCQIKVSTQLKRLILAFLITGLTYLSYAYLFMFAHEPISVHITFWLFSYKNKTISISIYKLFNYHHLSKDFFWLPQFSEFLSVQLRPNRTFHLNNFIKVILKTYDIYFTDKFIEFILRSSSLQRSLNYLKYLFQLV